MKMFKNLNLPICLLLAQLFCNPLYANDLDDSIGLDEAVKDDLDKSINIQYFVRSAKAKAAQSKGQTPDCLGAGNQIFGPGANLKNATIINLSNNKGTSSSCTK
jgi:hypothetical protein